MKKESPYRAYRERLKQEYEAGATLRELGRKYGRSFQASHVDARGVMIPQV